MKNLNIVVPITLNENIQSIIDSCMKKDGMNNKHSRSIKIPKYRAPINGNITETQETLLKNSITIEILKYYCKKIISQLVSGNCNMDAPVSKYIHNIVNKDIKGNDLLFIINSSEEQLLSMKTANVLELFVSRFINNNSIGEEHFNSSFLYDDLSIPDVNEKLYGFHPKYSKRIYMNLPRNSEITYKFGTIFVERCIDKNIPFDMKLFGSLSHNENNLDGSVFYSKNNYFEEHIKIIEEILKDYPEFKPYIGSPISTGGNIIDEDNNSFFAISHAGNCYYSRMGQTYNDVADTIINLTYIYSCCKIIKYYYAYFVNKINKDTMSKIRFVLSGNLEVEKFGILKDIEKEIRGLVYNFISARKNQSRDINKMLHDYIQQNINIVSSLVNFGDLNHIDIPMYEDDNFTSFRDKNTRKR